VFIRRWAAPARVQEEIREALERLGEFQGAVAKDVQNHLGKVGDDRLTVGKESKLNLDEIFGMTGKLSGYCEANGVTYDGWGAGGGGWRGKVARQRLWH